MHSNASIYLLRFLTNDLNKQVASSATKAVGVLGCCLPTIPLENSLFDYVDKSTTEGIQQLQTMIRAQVLELSCQLSVSLDMAATLLFDFGFFRAGIVASYLMDAEKTLGRSGLSLTSPNLKIADEEKFNRLLCGICYDEVTQDQVFALNCGHEFCQGCWKIYLETVGIETKYPYLDCRCPQHDCCSRVFPQHLTALAPKARLKWEETYLDAFLEMDSSCRQCPSLNCQSVAVVNIKSKTRKPTSCKCIECKKEFCYDCGEDPHRPATCEAMTEWTRVQAKSDFWVRRNAKPCPGCHAPIEKVQGCNHMSCTCGVEFCWLCLTPLDTYSGNHTCNRYDPTDDAEDDNERRALFVAERYGIHLQAEQFAEKQYQSMLERPDKLSDTFWFVSEEEGNSLRDALLTLCYARKYLRHSYVASFGLRRDTELLKTLENYQCALEMLTERLSQLTEINIQKLYIEKRERGVEGHFHGLEFYRLSVANYMDQFNAAVLKPHSLLAEPKQDV